MAIMASSRTSAALDRWLSYLAPPVLPGDAVYFLFSVEVNSSRLIYHPVKL
jgi:hypothetical protein